VTRPGPRPDPFVIRLSPEDIDRLASAAFEVDRRSGHHKGGPWTWHMISAQGQENYRTLVRSVLNELDRIEGRL
jgi:hypothetical protein